MLLEASSASHYYYGPWRDDFGPTTLKTNKMIQTGSMQHAGRPTMTECLKRDQVAPYRQTITRKMMAFSDGRVRPRTRAEAESAAMTG
jgi:hypothetical protein